MKWVELRIPTYGYTLPIRYQFKLTSVVVSTLQAN
jgi:hypothetical protein